jgi:hypothetical protein
MFFGQFRTSAISARTLLLTDTGVFSHLDNASQKVKARQIQTGHLEKRTQEN